MDPISMLMAFISAGFTLNFVLMGFMWKSISTRFDKVDQRFDRLEEKITDIDRRLCRLEGAFSAKEYCVLKNDQSRKAE